MIAIIPAIRLMRDPNRDKYPEVSVVLGTVSSFFLFYIFHATLVFVRHFYDLSGHEISTYNLWMIKVGQSLLLLIAYFWHFVRPALALSLDLDLKHDLSKLLNFRGYRNLTEVGRTNDLQSQVNTQQQHRPTTFSAHNEAIERRTGKWKIVSGVKHVFTKTLLGHNSTTTTMSDNNSFLIIPLTEIEMPTLHENSKTPFISTFKSTSHLNNCIDEENSSALTQTTEDIGENNC
jgi:hypothetical protein